MATPTKPDKSAQSPAEKKQAATVDKAKKFRESAQLQVNRALATLEKIGTLSNRKRYFYDVDQAEKVVGALKAGLDSVTKQYEVALTGTAEKQTKFTL